jgi:shikimate kinase
MNRHIFLIGFMGTGKSTVARVLAQLTGAEVCEMDEQIEADHGMSIKEIFSRYGESRFRELETELCRRFAKLPPSVVSCGGGVVTRPENVALLKDSGIVILLKAKPETVYERVKDSDARPILNGQMRVDAINDLMEQRRAAYESACDLAVDTDGKSPEEIARVILQKTAGQV